MTATATAQVGERVVTTLDTVVQVNETEAIGELSALLRAAGKGQAHATATAPTPSPCPTLARTLTRTLA